METVEMEKLKMEAQRQRIAEYGKNLYDLEQFRSAIRVGAFERIVVDCGGSEFRVSGVPGKQAKGSPAEGKAITLCTSRKKQARIFQEPAAALRLTYGTPRYDYYRMNHQAAIFSLTLMTDLDVFYLLKEHFGWAAYTYADPCDAMLSQLENMVETGNRILRKHAPHLKLNVDTGRQVADHNIKKAIQEYRQRKEMSKFARGDFPPEERQQI